MHRRDKIRVLLRLDLSKMPPNSELHRKDGDFPLAWARTYGNGRVFYSALGHAAATWDNPDRVNGHTDQFTVGYERQIANNMSVSADYVHEMGRDLLMAINLNPQVRSNPSTTTGTLTRVGSPTLTSALQALQAKYGPSFGNFTANVTQFVNTGQIDYDGLMLQLKKRFSHNYSAQVSYTLGNSRGNYSGSGAPLSNFQVGQDMHLDLNQGPTDNDIRHNFTVSGTALVPKTHGLNVSWVARALSGSPFSLTNSAVDPDLNGIQAEPLAAGSYAAASTATDAFGLKSYKSERNGARGPGFFEMDMRFGYRVPLARQRYVELAVDVFNMTNHTNFANPGGSLPGPGANTATVFGTSSFGNITAASGNRNIQLGAKLLF